MLWKHGQSVCKFQSSCDLSLVFKNSKNITDDNKLLLKQFSAAEIRLTTVLNCFIMIANKEITSSFERKPQLELGSVNKKENQNR